MYCHIWLSQKLKYLIKYGLLLQFYWEENWIIEVKWFFSRRCKYMIASALNPHFNNLSLDGLASCQNCLTLTMVHVFRQCSQTPLYMWIIMGLLIKGGHFGCDPRESDSKFGFRSRLNNASDADFSQLYRGEELAMKTQNVSRVLFYFTLWANLHRNATFKFK